MLSGAGELERWSHESYELLKNVCANQNFRDMEMPCHKIKPKPGHCVDSFPRSHIQLPLRPHRPASCRLRPQAVILPADIITRAAEST